MTHCALRGASIMYVEYLQNMGVAATLTMPILCEGELWGLIACHHCTPTHFPYQLRAACELLAQVASLQLRSAEQRESLAYRLKIQGVHQQVIAAAARDLELQPMVAGTPNLLAGLDAGGVALHHADRWWCAGDTPGEEELTALVRVAA